jgi:hypothetical protein
MSVNTQDVSKFAAKSAAKDRKNAQNSKEIALDQSKVQPSPPPLPQLPQPSKDDLKAPVPGTPAAVPTTVPGPEGSPLNDKPNPSPELKAPVPNQLPVSSTLEVQPIPKVEGQQPPQQQSRSGQNSPRQAERALGSSSAGSHPYPAWPADLEEGLVLHNSASGLATPTVLSRGRGRGKVGVVPSTPGAGTFNLQGILMSGTSSKDMSLAAESSSSLSEPSASEMLDENKNDQPSQPQPKKSSRKSKASSAKKAAAAKAVNPAVPKAKAGLDSADEASDAAIRTTPDQFPITYGEDGGLMFLVDITSRDFATDVLFDFEIQVRVPDYKHISRRVAAWVDSVAESVLEAIRLENATLAEMLTEDVVSLQVLRGLAMYSNCVGDGALDSRKGRGYFIIVRTDEDRDIKILVSQAVVGLMINRGPRTDKSVTIYRIAQVLYNGFADWSSASRYVPNWFPPQDKDPLELHKVPFEYRSNSNTCLIKEHANCASSSKFRQAFHDFMMTVPAERRPTYSRDLVLETLIANAAPAPQILHYPRLSTRLSMQDPITTEESFSREHTD